MRTYPGVALEQMDPARSVADKQGLLESLLSGKTLAATARPGGAGRVGEPPHRRPGARGLPADRRVGAGRPRRDVRTARQLSDGEVRRLEAALKRQYHRSVHLNIVIEPELIGGVRIEIGDDVIDGSVANRLDDAGRRLAG